jgi:hypothetical protein
MPEHGRALFGRISRNRKEGPLPERRPKRIIIPVRQRIADSRLHKKNIRLTERKEE